MYLYLAIHYPRPEYLDDLLESMQGFGQLLRETPGVVQDGAWREERGVRVVAMSFWESKEAFEAAGARMASFLQDVPFDVWEERPRELFSLVPVPDEILGQ